MPTNDFKPFATGAGANVMSQSDWVALAALATGFQSGKASSAQINKAIRQALFISSALAQYTADKSGQNVLDDGDVAGFVAKMHSAFSADFQPLDATLTTLAGLSTIANKVPYFTGTDVAALTDFTDIGRSVVAQTSIANLLTYLGLADTISHAAGAMQKSANGSDISNATSFLANIGISFTIGSGYIILKVGPCIIACGNANATTTSQGNLNVTLPTTFPNTVMFSEATQANSSYATDTDPIIYSPYSIGAGPITAAGFAARNTKTGAALVSTVVAARYFVVGF